MDVPQLVESLLNRAERVVMGQRENLESVLLALLCGGHVLLEGPPGTAKTLMARTLAQLLTLDCKRVQFTPDLMPSDILGTNVFNLQTSQFEFRAGPVFTDLLVADEINRTPPKTQAALLEVMEERTVTLDGVTHELSDAFMVIATQNPIEYEGTYRLPEAQLDRFLLKLHIDYPDADEEDRILKLYQDRGSLEPPLEILTPAVEFESSLSVSREKLLEARRALAEVKVQTEICHYIGNIVRATRAMDRVLMGASSRAAVHLLQASKARALIAGRGFISPDDVKSICPAVLRHRILLQPDAYVEGTTSDEVLATVLERVEVPR